MTDVVMPNMSGRHLMVKLKTLRPDLKVLYMTGYTNDEIIRQVVTGTSSNFIQKPFNLGW